MLTTAARLLREVWAKKESLKFLNASAKMKRWDKSMMSTIVRHLKRLYFFAICLLLSLHLYPHIPNRFSLSFCETLFFIIIIGNGSLTHSLALSIYLFFSWIIGEYNTCMHYYISKHKFRFDRVQPAKFDDHQIKWGIFFLLRNDLLSIIRKVC